MAKETAGGGGPTTGARERLRKRIQKWLDIREQIEELLDTPAANGVEPGASQLATLRETRADLVDSIQRLVKLHPKLADNAVNMGFNQNLIPKGEPQGPPSQPGGPGAEAYGEVETEAGARGEDHRSHLLAIRGAR